ncbi:hypothetical protein F5B21DRAFT_509139 [Xylaria acuta]|nr:hypothetical protein F5B21DRAFT_509139 [Xylaria acuta]
MSDLPEPTFSCQVLLADGPWIEGGDHDLTCTGCRERFSPDGAKALANIGVIYTLRVVGCDSSKLLSSNTTPPSSQLFTASNRSSGTAFLVLNTASQASFHRCLAQMQKGQVRVPDSLIYGLPYLEFSTLFQFPYVQSQPKGSAKRNDEIPKAEDDALPRAPTRSRLSAKPVDVPDLKDPEEENDPTVIDLIQESSASPASDQAEEQGLDLDDDGPQYPDEGLAFTHSTVPLLPRSLFVKDAFWKDQVRATRSSTVYSADVEAIDTIELSSP